jgi:hypothetical protein
VKSVLAVLALFVIPDVAFAQQNSPPKYPVVAAAALVTPEIPQAKTESRFEARYECDGTILHQLLKGALESPVSFWFGVNQSNKVSGVVTQVGWPLNLPSHRIQGQLWARRDAKGNMVGGRINVRWPYTLNRQGANLSIMRETFVRVGPRLNGFAKVKLMTSPHLYVAGALRFNPHSHPSLAGLNRSAFIAATCRPDETLLATRE